LPQLAEACRSFGERKKIKIVRQFFVFYFGFLFSILAKK
jgi:hypothetical protein